MFVKLWQVSNLKEQKFISLQYLHLNHIKNKLSITYEDFSTPSQMNVSNLTVNSSDANKDHRVFVIGGY